MSRAGFEDSSLSDLSDDDACEQMNKENQQDSDNENRYESPVDFADDHQRRIFEQQQLQRQQFYNQQRHFQTNSTVRNHSSSPDELEQDENSSPDAVSRSRMNNADNESGSSSDSDSSSSDSEAGDDQGYAYNANDWDNETTQKSDSQSPVNTNTAVSFPSSENANLVNYSIMNEADNANDTSMIDPSMDIDSMDVSRDVPSKSPEPVPEYLVDRIDQEKWPGVNGGYDNDGEWREWQEMSTAVNVYSGDIVNILPYVNISC